MATATSGTATYRRMAELAKSESAIADRHKLYQLRVPEELYDIEADPDCLHNLIASPAHRQTAETLRATLEQWMVRTNDGMLPVFRQRDDAAAREAYAAAQEQEAEARKQGKGKAQAAPRKRAAAPAAPRRRTGLIAFALPETVTPGKPVTVQLQHELPAELGEQTLTVTLKGGPDGRRLDRKTVTVSGQGVAQVMYGVPADVRAA
jgi:N-sulfoglucosamine sulfohydrolase